MSTIAPEVETRRCIPRVNIVERDDCVVLEAELPGVSKTGVSLEVKHGELTIAGRKESKTRTGRAHLRERTAADFHRVFALSNVLDPNRIEAAMCDGVLTVTLHKRDEVKARRVVVN